MLFPHFVIDEIKRQEQRDLTRFDLEFDLPDHFLPEFPAAIFLTTRPDLGEVSQGKGVTLDNFFALFNGVLNPKQPRVTADPEPAPLRLPASSPACDPPDAPPSPRSRRRGAGLPPARRGR